MKKIIKNNRKIFIWLIMVGLLKFNFVLAKYGLEATNSAANLKTGTSVPALIGNLIGAVLSMVGVLFFALMIYGGITWMTARGNQDQEKKALNTVTAAIIGIIIVVASYAITNFVFGALGL